MTEYLAYSEAAKQRVPGAQGLMESEYVLPSERSARMVLQLASGRADSLSGRFLDVNDNLDVTDELDALVGRVEDIKRDDLYVFRIRR